MSGGLRIGDTNGPHRGRIDPDAAYAFALATNDPNAVYRHGDAVPVLYTASLIQPSIALTDHTVLTSGDIEGITGGVHAEHDVTFLRHPRQGDPLEWTTALWAVHQTPVGTMVSRRTVIRDAAGEPLIEHLWSSLFLGGRIESSMGPNLPDHAFPEAARARPLGSSDVTIDRDQTYRYGGVSGDRVPHSMDDEAGREEGFPGKILQGMCSLSMCSGVLVALAGHGDPDRLRRLAARFRRPVQPGQVLHVRLFDAGDGDDGATVIAFEAVADGVTVISHGRAEFSDR